MISVEVVCCLGWMIVFFLQLFVVYSVVDSLISLFSRRCHPPNLLSQKLYKLDLNKYDRDLYKWEIVLGIFSLFVCVVLFYFSLYEHFSKCLTFSFLKGVSLKNKVYTIYGGLLIYSFYFSWKGAKMIKKLFSQTLNEKVRQWTVFSLILGALIYLHVAYWLLSSLHHYVFQ